MEAITSAEELFSEAYNFHNGYNGRAINKAKAIELYAKAAEMGHVEAMYRVSLFLEEKNSTQCLQWLTKAALLGYEPSIAVLGQHYMEGKGIPHDFDKAKACFMKLCFSKDKGRREWAMDQLRKIGRLKGGQKKAPHFPYSHK